MTRPAFLLIALSLILPSCNSVSLGGSEQDGGEQPAGGSTSTSGGSTSTSGSSRLGGSGGNGGTGALDAPVLGGQSGDASGSNSCRGLEIPDFDCGYGTPTYICVARGSGWAWDYTCPERPMDAGLPRTDTQASVDAATCPGPNPAARTCRSTASECIPSGCTCGGVGSPTSTWTCTADCRAYPLCSGDGGLDTTVSTGCDVTKAAQAVSAAGLTTVGAAQTLMQDLPANLSSSANWGVKESECSEGGYDLSAAAGKSVCLVSYASTGLCQQRPATVWVVMSEGSVRCIYQSADLNPGIYSVRDSLCSSPDAGAVSCPGPNPAALTCSTSTSDCIPSGCSCDSHGSWTCTADCRALPLCAADGGTSDGGDGCSTGRIDNTQAATLLAQYIRQRIADINPATTFAAEEKTVPNLWDTMQTQLFFGKMFAEDGSVWQEVAFLVRRCTLTMPTEDLWFGLIDSGVVANGAFYYSWGYGSGIYTSNLGKLVLDAASLVRTTGPGYRNPGSGPPGLVVALENARLVVYRATVNWGKFNEWLNPEPMGYLKDFGDRLAVVDGSGKEISTTLP